MIWDSDNRRGGVGCLGRREERPIIVLGAARSGTKMIRALLASHPQVVAIPYDINFVWKFGNYRVPHDELTPGDLSPKVRRYIHGYFRRWGRRQQDRRIVEKTVSNTLRVDFVRAVFPDCQCIHLIRDGRDVAASARRMWQAPLDWRSVIQKVVRFPLRGVPVYGRDYVASYLRRRVSNDHRVESWGPRFAGLDEVARTRPLLETCGVQWRRCLEATLAELTRVDESSQLEVRYEELVAAPQEQAARMLSFLGLRNAPEVDRYCENNITQGNVSKWRKEIHPEELNGLLAEIGSTLERLGYE